MASHAQCVATGLASSLLAVMRGFVLKCGSRCIGAPSRRGMAELVNLRIARKRAKKRQDDLRAVKATRISGLTKDITEYLATPRWSCRSRACGAWGFPRPFLHWSGRTHA